MLISIALTSSTVRMESIALRSLYARKIKLALKFKNVIKQQETAHRKRFANQMEQR